MCEVLQVSRAGFYRWRQRVPSTSQIRQAALLTFLLDTAQAEHGIPGYRKLWCAAVDQGYTCSKNTVQKLLQGVGYRSCVAMKPGYRKPKSTMPTLPNLLNRTFTADASNQVWTSDITQIRCTEGWLYIAVILDLYSRAVVGWASSFMNTALLVESALKAAWALRKPKGKGMLFHSDQGCQYRSQEVVSWLNKKGFTLSMSRKGNCWDNACSESFFAQMKKEWFKHRGELSRAETHIQAQFYIEDYYNTIRRHGALNQQSPMAFERNN